MMAETVEKTHLEAERQGILPPKILGVTVLTSLGQTEFQQELGFSGEIEGKVVQWAKMAKSSGLDGVVASAREAQLVKQVCGDDFLIVTPGIRPGSEAVNDQKRVLTPEKAIEQGSTHLVVGRAITNKANTKEKKSIVKEIYHNISEVVQ